MSEPTRQTRHPNLLAGPASPEQTRGLKRGNVQHGAYSVALREPLELEYRAAERRRYPDAPDVLVNSQARRLAMAHLFGAVIDDDGVIVKRRGVQDVSAPARELRLLLEAIDRAEVQLATYDDRTQHSAAHVALLRGRGELPAGEDHDADAELADEVNER